MNKENPFTARADMTPDDFPHLLEQYDTRQISLRSIEEGWDDIVKPETGISVQKDWEIGHKILHTISLDYDDVRIIKDTQASLVFP